MMHKASSPATSSPRTCAGKNVAILDDKSPYGKGLADETRKALNAAGGKEVLNKSYTAGEKDYTALVSKMKEAKVDVVYVGGYHTEGAAHPAPDARPGYRTR